MAIRGSHLDLQRAYEPARRFDDANPDYLQIDSAPVAAAPLTLACWFTTDDLTIDQALLGIYDASDATERFMLAFAGTEAGDPLRAYTANGGWASASTTTSVSANTWHHGCAVYAASNSRAAYLDGGGKGTNAFNKTPVGLDRITIGREGDSAPQWPLSGRTAWPTIWSCALSDEEVAVLGDRRRFTPPWEIRPESIVAMPNLRTLWDPYMKARWTPTGTVPAPAPHIWRPRQVSMYVPVPLAKAFAISRYEAGGFIGYHVAWSTDSDGLIVEWLPWDLDGTLHALTFTHDDAAVAGSSYDITILDPLDADVLDGLGTANYNTTNRRYLHHGISSGRIRPISVMGRHRIEIDTANDSTWGEFDLFILPRLVDRFADGGAHE